MKHIFALLFISTLFSGTIKAHQDLIWTLTDTSHVVQLKSGFHNFNLTKLEFFSSHLKNLLRENDQQDSVFIIIRFDHIYIPNFSEPFSKLKFLDKVQTDSLSASRYCFPEMNLGSKRIWLVRIAQEEFDYSLILAQIEYLLNNQTKLESQRSTLESSYLEFNDILPKPTIHDAFNQKGFHIPVRKFVIATTVHFLPADHKLESNLIEYRILDSEEKIIYSFENALYTELFGDSLLAIVETKNKITIVNLNKNRHISGRIPLGGYMSFFPPRIVLAEQNSIHYRFIITQEAASEFDCDGDSALYPEYVEITFDATTLESEIIDDIDPCGQ